MSSANEHLPPPPPPPSAQQTQPMKTRLSPLDYRNTDLVSRLLAATPPYLYNMSLLPNTYFFSEMLRSLVQAKNESANNNRATTTTTNHLTARRARKRPWHPIGRTDVTINKSTSPTNKMEHDWSNQKTLLQYQDRKICERPLELTTRNVVIDDLDRKCDATTSTITTSNTTTTSNSNNLTETIFTNPETAGTSLILPPPPPIWYPPLYPTTPYANLDPLHFFIDLRVSGHIWDRKIPNNKSDSDKINEENSTTNCLASNEPFKTSRHTSAFSVPTGQHVETKKFDVKSMGFEKLTNRIGLNFIMTNLLGIYKNIEESSKGTTTSTSSATSKTDDGNDEETEEQRQKRVKDLRALIGLELVVDYMNHTKPTNQKMMNESNDYESVGSPALEVVALNDET